MQDQENPSSAPLSPAQADAEELLALAASRNAEDRADLSQRCLELFEGRAADLNDRELELIGDIIARLLCDLELEVRRRLAEKLSTDNRAPRGLVRALANDDIVAARSLIVASEVLGDEDLMAIVRHRTRQHRLAVALRRNLGEPVCDELVRSGETDVVCTLLKNQSAVIPPATLQKLVARSAEETVYQEPLVRREDLPADLGARLGLVVAARLRAELIDRFAVAPGWMMTYRMFRRFE